MIRISDNLNSVLSQDIFEMFYLVKIHCNPPLNLTTYGGESITLSDGTEFVNDGSLVSIDPPPLSTSVDRAEFKIVLADNDQTIFDELRQRRHMGARLEVFLSAVGEDGIPITETSDILLTYGGRIGGLIKDVDTEESGEILLTLVCTSPVGKLDAKRVLYTSKEFLRSQIPDDAAYDYVYQGSGRLALRWGKS